MKVSEQIWKERMSNLMERRKVKSDNHHLNSPVADYTSHLKKIKIGSRLLDVGCGDMKVRNMIPSHVVYLGIDAFPVSSEVVKMKIEECYFSDRSFDTIICFAVLDGMEDLDKAFFHLKRICNKNILILTGIDIPVDQYHTFTITEEMLFNYMKGWKTGIKKYLEEKVLLIEFIK